MSFWFDGHLDLAYLQQTGRDLTLPCPAATAVSFPALRAGGVGGALATIFIQRRHPERQVDGPWCFDSTQEAHEAMLRQLDTYQQWETQGWIRRLRRAGEIPEPLMQHSALPVVLLLEGAAGVRGIEDLELIFAAGVRVIALSWVDGTPWAGGDQSGGDLTEAGGRLVTAIDRLGMIHDLSHLSERSFWSLLAQSAGAKIASHSNARALLPGKAHPERHLSDAQIRALAEVGGIIGINLFARFLVSSGPAHITDLVSHIRHMSQLVGRVDFLALGSDFDGGFGTSDLPADLQGPGDLMRLAEALSSVGYSDAEIAGFAHGNWRRFLQASLPR